MRISTPTMTFKVNEEEQSDLIILYSGGSDSRLMLKMALERGRKPLLVYVRYCQSGTHHDHKPDLFQLYCDLGVNYRDIKIYGLHYDFKRKWDGLPDDYLPNRNMILVVIAGAIAEQEGIKDIWYGANKSDIANGYPDCTSEWIGKMNEILESNLHAPLLLWTQEEVIQKLDDSIS